MQAVHKVFFSLSFSFSIWAERWNVWAARKANGRSAVRKVRTLTLKHPPLVTPQHKLTERKWEPVHVDHNKVCFYVAFYLLYISVLLFIYPAVFQPELSVCVSVFVLEEMQVFSAGAEILIRNPLCAASKAGPHTVDVETGSKGAQQTCYNS